MTVQASTVISGPFTGNGVTTSFPRSFSIGDASHVVVTFDGVTQSSGYTVVDPELVSADIVFDTAPASGVEIYFTRQTPNVQETDYSSQGKVSPEQIETDLDDAERQIQEIARDVARAPKVPIGSSAPKFTATTRNSALILDPTTGDIVSGPTVSEISNAQGYAETASSSSIIAVSARDQALGAVPNVHSPTRTAIKALPSTVTNVYLLEKGREGHFHKVDSDLSAEIVLFETISSAVDSGSGLVTSQGHNLQARQAVFTSTAVNGLLADTLYYVIDYTTESIDYISSSGTLTVGNTLTGVSSGATATITKVVDRGFATRLWISGRSGSFQNGETLSDGVDTATGFSPVYTTKNDDVFSLANSYVNAVAGTNVTLTGSAAITLKAHADPVEAFYLIPSDRAFDGSQGGWIRQPEASGQYHINWGGAAEALDIRPIFDSMKYLAAGAALIFDAQSYATSDTLEYLATQNRPLDIKGISEGLTTIVNSSSNFVFHYYGGMDGGNEARGGGVSHMTLEKTGGGICNGVDIANVYRGQFHHLFGDATGGVGIRITSRGAGDTDATVGVRIYQNSFRSGVIGFQVRGDVGGAVPAAYVEVRDNNFDGSKSSGIWLAGVDQIYISDNTLTNCGNTGGGAHNGRGGLYCENHGIHCRNVYVERNEFGNGTPGCDYNVIIDGLLNGEFRSNRHIRNAGESGLGAYVLGFSVSGSIVRNVTFAKETVIVSDLTAYTMFASAGSSISYIQNTVHDIEFLLWTATSHTVYGNSSLITTKINDDPSSVARIATGQLQFPSVAVLSSDPNTLDRYSTFDYTPVVTSQTGAITSYSVNTSVTRIGRLLSINGQIDLSDVGTAGGKLFITLPAASASASAVAAVKSNTAQALIGDIPSGGTDFGLTFADGTTVAANGVTLRFSAVYTTN